MKLNHTSTPITSSKILRKRNVAFCMSMLLGACGFQQYVAKPIDTATFVQKIESKNPDGEAFHQFLISTDYYLDRTPIEPWPIQQWDVTELSLCAFFFHPSLDVARAQWRLAETKQLTAAENPIPSANSNFARSNNANDDISPYALSFSIGVPIETANKRDFRIENAHHLSQAAKLEIAQLAWQLRSQVAQSLYEYQFNQQQIKLLLTEQAKWQAIVALYQKRINLGEASNIELSTAKLHLQTTTNDLNTKQKNKLVLLSKLANSIGLPLSKVEIMPLKAWSIKEGVNTEGLDKEGANKVAGNTSPIIIPTDSQASALLNRLDIRIALERYAAAEAKLKLEIAKQYPDITISPGYAYEFGNHVWSLGLSGLLTLLNKNKVAIAEATQLREVEAAQFEALQNSVISEVNIASAKLTEAHHALENQKILYKQQQQNLQRMERRLSAGEIDRLELSYAQLEQIAAEKNVLLANFQLQSAINAIENALQQPFITGNIKNEPR